MQGKHHSEESKKKMSEAALKRFSQPGVHASTWRDLSGQQFGRLTVLEYAGTSSNKHSLYLCKCECGNEKIIHGTSLTQGKTKSCGCLHREETSKLMTTHGLTKEHRRICAAWSNMKDRCNNPANKFYSDYGGRGIIVCNEWEEDVVKFVEWALANGYNDKLTIDRIDNDGNYEPGNCKWSTPKEQNRNMRRNLKITVDGETKIVTDWAETCGISVPALAARYRKGERGDILSRPPRTKKGGN